MKHDLRFDRSQLYSDEAPPIGSIGIESWTEVAFPVIVWLLRWNRNESSERLSRRFVHALRSCE
jgi:hypothetical protein